MSLLHGLVKVRPDDAVPTDAVVDTISAAQNEYESVQVRVFFMQCQCHNI